MTPEEYTNKYVQLFIKEVIHPLIPNAKLASGSQGGNEWDIQYSSAIELSAKNRIFIDTDYYYKGKLEFIHYTALPHLINIITEKAIRLYDFNYLNDPQEGIVSKKIIQNYSESKASIKSSMYCLSMCEYDTVENPDSFDMWRLYANDGNGVGIVFSIDDSNREFWVDYHLSRTYYDANTIFSKKFDELAERSKNFHEKYNFKITNVPSVLYKLTSFHKNSIWSSENEVRLIYYDADRGMPVLEREQKFPQILNRQYQSCRYFKIGFDMQDKVSITRKCQKYDATSIAHDDEINNFKYIHHNSPRIKIIKIILGYQYSATDCFKIKTFLNELFYNNLGYFPEIVSSPISENFK